jgi:predicted nucleic acid-binding protein
MAKGILIDTDVLIDYLRGDELSRNYLESLSGPWFVSVITVAELYAGVREERERTSLDAFVQSLQILPTESNVAKTGGLMRRDHRNSSGIGLADALIAATATIHDLNLVTLNKKHYPMMSDVIVPYQKT